MNQSALRPRSWRLGLIFAATAMLFWATLPLALKYGLEALDPWTLTWFRFLFAALLSLPWLMLRGGMVQYRSLGRNGIALLLLAAVMLTANYMLYLLGLAHISPANAQVIIQLAPVLMALGGLLLFQERYRWLQWLGFATLLLGLGLFFHNQLGTMGEQAGSYLRGVLMVVAAAVVWAVYALAQKQIASRLSSLAIMTFIYLCATLLLLPMAKPTAMLALTAGQWLVVLFCAINTLGAYGAFSEALYHWDASRVSAVLALTPLGTVCLTFAINLVWPGTLPPERIDLLGWMGALMVVGGSMATSLGGRRKAPASASTEL